MPRLVLLVLLTLSLSLPVAHAIADPIDDLVNAELQRRHIPGLSLAVVRHGKVEKTAAYGLANVELNVPVAEHALFQIQSITKTFTSAAILMLVDEGKLDLADPVSKYLGGTPDTWKPITLRHLLSHTSGIKDFINEPTASIRLDVSEEDVLRATAPRPLNFTPGEKYAYSNTNYHLLAMILRKVTGKFYGDVLEERIFDPLGMSDTRIVTLKETLPNRVAGYRWSGNRLQNGDFVAQSVLSYGGGGVLSTAADMAKWAMALDAGKLLEKETLALAWTGVTLNDGKTSGYGLGWGVGTTNGHRYVGHTGAHITGFTSAIMRYRDDDLTVIVLTNAGHANPSRIAQQVAGLYVPALAPKETAKAIDDKEPNVTAMLRGVGDGIRTGKLDQTEFTPEMWGVVSSQLKDLQAAARQDGALKTVELLERRDEGKMKHYLYRMTAERQTYLVTLLLDPQGKIAGLLIQTD